MNPKNKTHQGDKSQAYDLELQNRRLLQSLDPSLWNSPVGRRSFVKKAGAATIGTAIALHGYRMEVLASESADCIWKYTNSWVVEVGRFPHTQEGLADAIAMAAGLPNHEVFQFYEQGGNFAPLHRAGLILR